MDKIPTRVVSDLLPAIVEAAKSTNVVLEDCWKDPVAVEIPDFASLGPMMLTQGKPVWSLSKAETGWKGEVWNNRKPEMDAFRERFSSLADRVLK